MDALTNLIANIIILIGLGFMALGIFGTFRFNDFFNRILITAKVDTVGFIAILFGYMIKMGFTFFTLKIFLVMVLYVVTNPIGTHSILRSADIRDYKIKKEK